MKKLFLLDYKVIDDLNISETETSVMKILKRYSLGIGDYEQNALTEAIFNRLGWSNKYKDTAFSFPPIIYNMFEFYSDKNEIQLDDGKRIKFYFEDNTLKYKIDNCHKDKYKYIKSTLFTKLEDEKSALNIVMKKIINDKEIFDKLETVARLIDSLSNFITHPGYPFNQAKGELKGVTDSLNLMIDKIQECIDNNENLQYGDRSKTIKLDELKKWQEWFIRNQSVYCLPILSHSAGWQKNTFASDTTAAM